MPLSGAGRKRKGSRRELQLIKYLEGRGYACCHAGSSLGMWDIVAIPYSTEPRMQERRFTLLIQLKSNRPPDRKERALLAGFRTNSANLGLIVVAPDGYSVKDWMAYYGYDADGLGVGRRIEHVMATLEDTGRVPEA